MVRNLFGMFLKRDIDDRGAGARLKKRNKAVKLLIKGIRYFYSKGKAAQRAWDSVFSGIQAERTWGERQECERSHPELC